MEGKELMIKLGGLDLDKGEVRPGHTFFMWDAVQDCVEHECPVYDECKYEKRDKCAVQVKYVSSICHVIINTYKYLDDVQLTKIGVQLVPLYSHLCRLKIIEKSITLGNIVGSTAKGIQFIHPVFKEIRQTMLMINQMWRDLLIRPINLMTPDPSDPSAPLSNPDNDPRLIDGDRTYYKKLTRKHVPAKGGRDLGISRKGLLR